MSLLFFFLLGSSWSESQLLEYLSWPWHPSEVPKDERFLVSLLCSNGVDLIYFISYLMMYCTLIMHINFFQSLMLVYFTLVDKYAMTVWMSGLVFLVRNSPLTSVAWKYFLCWSFRFSAFFLVLNRKSDVGVVVLVDKSSGYYFIISLLSR